MSLVSPEDIAAIVVLYRPAEDVLENLEVTAKQVRTIIAIDNSEEPDAEFTRRLGSVKGVQWVPMGRNAGIAAALNEGVRRAAAMGKTWVLTLDQDSTPDDDMVASLASCVTACSVGMDIGIISPMQRDEGGPTLPRFLACRQALTVITSGNLLSVAAWSEVGGFDESLFIDQVDHDMCLKLHVAGFAVMRCGSAGMTHRVGSLKEHRFPRPAFTTGHSPLRRYYITRNRFIVSQRYGSQFPDFRRREMRALRRELAKIVLYEDQKWAKLLMSWRGYMDYRRGVAGPYHR